MNYTPEQIHDFHRHLHRLCGFPQLSPTDLDLRNWWDFLRQLEPLRDTPEGGFTVSDLTGAVAYMAEQRRKGVGWSMRPSTILRDPEKFRDLILEVRARLKMRKREPERPIIQKLPTGTTRITDDQAEPGDAVPVGDVAAKTFSQMRKEAGL